MTMSSSDHLEYMFYKNDIIHEHKKVLSQPPPDLGRTAPLTVDIVAPQGWKLMSCGHCLEFCQQVTWLLIGCTRVNNQSEARSASWPNCWQWLQLISFHPSRETRTTWRPCLTGCPTPTSPTSSSSRRRTSSLWRTPCTTECQVGIRVGPDIRQEKPDPAQP